MVFLVGCSTGRRLGVTKREVRCNEAYSRASGATWSTCRTGRGPCKVSSGSGETKQLSYEYQYGVGARNLVSSAEALLTSWVEMLRSTYCVMIRAM